MGYFDFTYATSDHSSDLSLLNIRSSGKAGFTNSLSRLKPRAAEKMRGLITNNEDLFLLSTNILKPFFSLSRFTVGVYISVSARGM